MSGYEGPTGVGQLAIPVSDLERAITFFADGGQEVWQVTAAAVLGGFVHTPYDAMRGNPCSRNGPSRPR
jgi:hypothetical protein